MYEVLNLSSGRRKASERRLMTYAAQLLLNTHHAAGRTMGTQSGWPRGWVYAQAHNAGRHTAFANRKAQARLLRYRAKLGFWPDPDTQVALFKGEGRARATSKLRRAVASSAHP